jgi:hypothetical protein
VAVLGRHRQHRRLGAIQAIRHISAHKVRFFNSANARWATGETRSLVVGTRSMPIEECQTFFDLKSRYRAKFIHLACPAEESFCALSVPLLTEATKTLEHGTKHSSLLHGSLSFSLIF